MMPAALAVTMLSAVALSLTVLGALGAGLAAWQLLGWAVVGGLPVIADAWRGAGVAGTLLVAFFDYLPVVLGIAMIGQSIVAWLGLGLLWRRPWARRATIGFAFVWTALAVLLFGIVRYALEDLARGYPERSAFAHAAESLSTEITLVNVALAAALVLLLIQPAVRAQFSAGR